ncbi:MAG: hypothetical protein DSY46_04360 [Hydrogenimonas sp.]|nr:MAG: hypothetical protein DSY46_04360 [Hydrogenimonas sp.]
MSSQIDRLKALANEISTYEIERKKNLRTLETLFRHLKLDQKVESFQQLFEFKAMNLSGISLQPERLGESMPGKYAQIIAINYIEEEGKKRAKNVNLRYFGRVENLDNQCKQDIVEFILRWRLEKSFRSVDHYRQMMHQIDSKRL